jgi:hypothetical protein
MLTKASIASANEINEVLSYSNKKLSLAPHSILGTIVNTLRGIGDTGSNEELIQRSSQVITVTGSHGEKEDYYVQALARITNNTVKVARNTVRPLCLKIVEDVEKENVLNHQLKIYALGSIVQVEPPKLMNDAALINLISRFSDVPATPVNIGKLSDEERGVLITTGAKTLDDAASQFIGNAVPPWINRAFDDVVDIGRLSIQQTLFYFLFTLGIENNRLDSLTYIVEDPELLLKVTELKAALAGQLARYFYSFEHYLKTSKLVIVSDDVTRNAVNSIAVFGPVYRKWIEEKEGSPEAALGFLLATNKGYASLLNGQELFDNPTRFEESYNNQLLAIKNRQLMEDPGIVKDHVHNAVTSYINSPDSNLTEERHVLHSRLAKVIEESHYYGGDNLSTFVIKVICRTIFEERQGKDIKCFLLNADQILKMNPEMDAKQAVYLAVIKFLAAWVKDQLIISKVQ